MRIGALLACGLAFTAAPVMAQRSASFQADSFGQFWINGRANGAAVRFLADTGASGIVFGRRDARRLGIAVKQWDGVAPTVNGGVRAAWAHLARLDVGSFSFRDVEVEVDDADGNGPLLGMSFLRQFKVVIENGTMTLSQEPGRR
jgi:aspartyl protease family protein